ncbi:MAG: hypothetical protein RIR14_1917 [Pseudomonadota bacterium]
MPGLRPFLWAGAALLCLAPLVAQQAVAGFNWSGGDFVLFAALVLGMSFTMDRLAASAVPRPYKAGVLAMAAASGGTILVSGAVGLVGGEGEDANRVFALFPVVALLMAFLGRGRARWMARLCRGIAMAHIGWSVAIPAFGLVPDAGRYWPDAMLCASLFGGLWLAPARLFRKAAAVTPESIRVA